MTAGYRAVQWNRHKLVYDLVVIGVVVMLVAVFVMVGIGAWGSPNQISLPVLLIRGTAIAAIALLHVILAIGPAARLTDRVAPLLYNRRHLGVMFFLVASAHAAISLGYYGGFGVRDPVSAVLTDHGSYGTIASFPFEVLGFFALLVFFVMASTSHDFWLATLGARAWKWIHMLVYAGYGLVVFHVALGALQAESSRVYAAALLAGAGGLVVLHGLAALRGLVREGRGIGPQPGEDWLDVCGADEIVESAARVVYLRDGAGVAVFHHDGGFSAVANVCAHQGGPLGEGRIVGGCITCPWHGYQYMPENGRSPPPYTEKVATHRVRVRAGRVEVDPRANPPGTHVEPARAGVEAEHT